MLSEAKLRDYLAKHLDVLDEGLTLIEVEHKLENPFGAKGFIDILARDRFGNRVVIELKRSDATARQALHELYKYIALFRINYGLASHQIRCLIVSTEWHELIVPFAEFARTVDYQVEGYVLKVDELGTIVSASLVSLPNLSESQSLSTNHYAYLFSNVEKRNKAIAIVESALQHSGCDDFICVSMKYEGDNQYLVGWATLYVVPGKIRPEAIEELKRRARQEYELEDDAEVDNDQIDGAFSLFFTERVTQVHDDFEIGYPDKFLSIQHQGWKCECIHRHGQWASDAARTDDELYRLISGEEEGTNTVLYRRMSGPHMPLHWRDFKDKAELCFQGNAAWLCGFNHICKIVEEMDSRASISVATYNPKNWLISLFKLLARGMPDYLPTFEAVVTSAGNKKAWVLIGVVTWNGVTKLGSIQDLFQGLCEDTFEFFQIHHLGGAWTLDAEITRRFGLSYQILLWDYENEPEPKPTALCYENESLVEIPKLQQCRSLEDFVLENQQLLHIVMAEISSVSIGL